MALWLVYNLLFGWSGYSWKPKIHQLGHNRSRSGPGPAYFSSS